MKVDEGKVPEQINRHQKTTVMSGVGKVLEPVSRLKDKDIIVSKKIARKL